MIEHFTQISKLKIMSKRFTDLNLHGSSNETVSNPIDSPYFL